MPDILKLITHPDSLHDDPFGHLAELDAWSEDKAMEFATDEGLLLTDAHWEVIQFLRSYCRDYGPADNGRELLAILAEKFAHQGGSQYLYRLFPQGPVNQASRIAGLPRPANTTDPSFGHTH